MNRKINYITKMELRALLTQQTHIIATILQPLGLVDDYDMTEEEKIKICKDNNIPLDKNNFIDMDKLTIIYKDKLEQTTP